MIPILGSVQSIVASRFLDTRQGRELQKFIFDNRVGLNGKQSLDIKANQEEVDYYLRQTDKLVKTFFRRKEWK